MCAVTVVGAWCEDAAFEGGFELRFQQDGHGTEGPLSDPYNGPEECVALLHGICLDPISCLKVFDAPESLW